MNIQKCDALQMSRNGNVKCGSKLRSGSRRFKYIQQCAPWAITIAHGALSSAMHFLHRELAQ